MSNVITRKYLLDRYVFIPESWMTALYARINETSKDTDTLECLERKVFAAVTAEENRQIRNGIQKTLELNFAHNRITRPLNTATGQIELRASK